MISWRKLLSIKFLIVLFVVSQVLAQTSAISTEIKKLEDLNKTFKPGPNNPGFDPLFKDLEKELEANRLFAALYKLQNLWLGVVSFSYDEKKSLIVQDKLPLLEIEWKKAGEDLSAKEKRFSPAVINQCPAISRAIIQALRHRSRPLYQSSILYGKNTNPNQGLYYIGNAQAGIDLALFAQNLRFQSKKRNTKFVSLEPELTDLERRIIESYRTSSPDDQARYNALNAALKVAQELDERSWYEGAMLKYLEVVLAYGLLKNPTAAADEIPSMRTKLNEKTAALAKNNIDQSIGMTFLEVAQSLLANQDAAIKEADLKRVKVILNDVLPKYQNKISNKGSQ